MDVTAVGAGLLACGSSLLSRLPGASSRQWHRATGARRSQLRGQRRSWHSFRSVAPASLLASSSLDSEDPDNRQIRVRRTGSQWPRQRRAQCWNFFLCRAFRIYQIYAPSRPDPGRCDSPKPTMRAHAALPDRVDMLQVSVLAAKKCRFHAPRGQDANMRVA
jgi:hypothetical protein